MGVLMVPPKGQVQMPPDIALRRIELLAHELEQSGLAGAVRAHQGDARVQIHREIDFGVQVVLPQPGI